MRPAMITSNRKHQVDKVEEREQVIEYELLDRFGLELGVDVDAPLGNALGNLEDVNPCIVDGESTVPCAPDTSAASQSPVIEPPCSF